MMSRTRRWCQLRATLLVEEESAHQFHFIGSRGRSVTRVCCSHNYTDQIIIIFNAEKNNADSVVKWSTVQAMSAMSVQRFNCGVHCSCRVSTFCWGTHSLHWKFVDGFCVGITSREWGKATRTANDSGVLCNENPYKSSMKMCMCLSAPLRSNCPARQILRPRSMHATSHTLPEHLRRSWWNWNIMHEFVHLHLSLYLSSAQADERWKWNFYENAADILCH